MLIQPTPYDKQQPIEAYPLAFIETPARQGPCYSAGSCCLQRHCQQHPRCALPWRRLTPLSVFFDSHNQLSGFEIDLANAVCSLLDRSCAFEHQPFEGLILNLKFHRSDAIISAMDITATRAQQVAFTQPYYHNTAIFIILKDTFQQVAALQQQRIGVQRGSTHQNYILEQHPGMQVVTYDSYQNSLIDLKNGRIQAIFADTAVASQWLKQDQHLATLGQPVTEARYFGGGIAIAVRQQDSALLTSLDQALRTLKENGTLQTLQQRWFD